MRPAGNGSPGKMEKPWDGAYKRRPSFCVRPGGRTYLEMQVPVGCTSRGWCGCRLERWQSVLSYPVDCFYFSG